MKLYAAAAILVCAAATTVASETIPVVDRSRTGEELIDPPQIYCRRGRKCSAQLRLGIVEYIGPAYTTKLRAYNGMLPGPTIHVKPGDVLDLMVVNDLTEPVGNLQNNEFQHPNQTNIHLHGLHISGESPGDNVFITIGEGEGGTKPYSRHLFHPDEELEELGYVQVPGKSVGPKQYHNYHYCFDESHMPGTHWYHPHLHGSTALQTSTSNGMFIVDDTEDIPAIIRHMPEVQIVFNRYEIGDGGSIAEAECGPPGPPPNFFPTCGSGGLSRWSKESGDRVSNWTDGEGLTITDNDFEPEQIFERGVWMPNGQIQPVKTISANVWYRFRIALAVSDISVVMGFERGKCEMKLLAKDGVYVKVDPTNSAKDKYGPRPIEAIFLSPGNRADVAIRCADNDNMKTIAEGVGSFEKEGVRFEGFDPEIPSAVYPDPNSTNTGQGLIFSIVTEGSGDDDDLPEYYEIHTPCYLADLRGVEPDEEKEVFYNPFGEPMSIGRPRNPPGGVFEGIPWVNDTTPFDTLTIGTIIESNLATAGAHPHHQHINHFQLQGLEDSDDYTNTSELTRQYYKTGDFHDTFQWTELFINELPPSGIIEIRIRWQVTQFSGRMPFHCHRLNHEDLGMIGFYQIEGEEGTLVNTTGIDPTCKLPTGKCGRSGKSAKQTTMPKMSKSTSPHMPKMSKSTLLPKPKGGHKVKGA